MKKKFRIIFFFLLTHVLGKFKTLELKYFFFTKTCFTRDIIRGDIVRGDFVRGDIGTGGYCPGGFCPGGILSGGILSGGYCPGGYCPGGYCPDTVYTVSEVRKWSRLLLDVSHLNILHIFCMFHFF